MTSKTALICLLAILAPVALAPSPAVTLLAQNASTLSRKAAVVERLARDETLRVRVVEARRAADDATQSVFVPGLLAVKFAEGADPATVAALAAEHGASRVSQPAFADHYLFAIDAQIDVVAAARALARQPGVVYAEPVGRAFPTYRPNDPLYQYQWNFQQLDLERVWDINRGAPGAVAVAIIDGGIAYAPEGADYLQAPDLAGTTFLPGYDFIWDDDKPLDFDGHGTHVTGTIAQSTNNNLGTSGMAFNVSVIPIKAISGILDELAGAPNVGSSSTVTQAVRFAAEHGAKVINMSLTIGAPSTPLRDAIQFAVDRGAIVVIAAGNAADEGSPPSYPAVYARDMDGVIAVGATDYSRPVRHIRT
ncbi:MAG: S8 family serine peptidase [Vicinamibacteria bacterium]|nr:S8 family serine peptidase [Vicinamibacteria bacterium]